MYCIVITGKFTGTQQVQELWVLLKEHFTLSLFEKDASLLKALLKL